MTVQDIEKLVRPIKTRVLNMVAKAVIKLAGNGTAQVEVNGGEVRDNLLRLQEYGFSSRPKPGADAVVVFIGGNRDHGLVVSSGDPRTAPTLEEGEVAFWSADGVVVKIDKDKKVRITGAASIDLNGDSKRFVTWDELNTALQSHTHSAGSLVSTAPGSPVTGVTGSPVSLDISGAKTTSIKTGG